MHFVVLDKSFEEKEARKYLALATAANKDADSEAAEKAKQQAETYRVEEKVEGNEYSKSY